MSAAWTPEVIEDVRNSVENAFGSRMTELDLIPVFAPLMNRALDLIDEFARLQGLLPDLHKDIESLKHDVKLLEQRGD